MKRSILPLLLAVFLLPGCGNRTSTGSLPVLSVPCSSVSSDVQLEELATASLVRLPSSDSLLLNDILRIHADAHSIWLSDRSSVYCFSPAGELLRRLSRQGQGPGEYTGITDFQVDAEGNVWVLSRSQQRLFLYGKDDRLLRTLDLPLWVENMKLVEDGLLLYSGNEPDDSGMQLHWMDLSSGTILRHAKPLDRQQAAYLHVHNRNPFQFAFSGGCHFSQLFNDTVYTLTEAGAVPSAVVDFEGHNVPASFYAAEYQDIMEFFQKFHGVGTYAYGLNLFLDTPQAYCLSYYYQKQCCLAVLPKSGTGQRVMNGFRLSSPLSDYPVDLNEVAMFAQDDGSIILPLDAASVKEYYAASSRPVPSEVSAYLQEVGEDANPFLLVVRFHE